MKKIAIIGRPNVGKSTLFNRLIGKKKAIVHDTPGVTRDRRIEEASLGDIKFHLIDTAGLEKAENESLQDLMFRQTEMAANEADIILLMVDAATDLTPDDRYFAKWTRKKDKPIILVANKCERKDSDITDALSLGFGEAVAISAEHGLGMEDLYTALGEYLSTEEAPEFPEDETEKERLIELAIVGRPNVGKSTIINKILNEQRVITSPVAGTTRDAIAIDWKYKDHDLRLIDTAGMRKKSNVVDNLEYFSVGDSLNSIRYAQIVMLVVDATDALEKQDLRIAKHIINEGRALIFVANKWDLVKNKDEYRQELRYLLGKNMNDVAGIEVLTISALNNESLDELLDAALSSYEKWNKRVSTGKLNRWLEEIMAHHPPPIHKGKRIKIRYISQTKTRPPTFMLSLSQKEGLPDAYVKYLKNNLRESFGLAGIPLRMMLRKGDNPYAKNNPR
ncbi:MAG: ribosome biogenesis GTPase Der [Alphaproteobacteria bacterium CG11_big_fil_rev_8_21_14_0_20_44_7]|nr:MAG: ribosome biogenesis GTPase Der [Alphaproteobacteria bacterium CG11_big_fil_rev_8_21_14_0_20_44_7]